MQMKVLLIEQEARFICLRYCYHMLYPYFKPNEKRKQ